MIPEGVGARFVRVWASFFGIGYLPVMPGTFGSLAGVLLAWYFYGMLGTVLFFLTLSAFLICKSSESSFACKDPQRFVLDEVCGMMLSVVWIPKTLPYFAAAFILFRLFDTLKPWPIRAIQNHKHPSSIVWDDLAAGLFTNLLLQIFILVFEF